MAARNVRLCHSNKFYCVQNVNSGRCAVVFKGECGLVKYCEYIHHAMCSALSLLVIIVAAICLGHKMQGVWLYKWCGLDV